MKKKQAEIKKNKMDGASIEKMREKANEVQEKYLFSKNNKSNAH